MVNGGAEMNKETELFYDFKMKFNIKILIIY